VQCKATDTVARCDTSHTLLVMKTIAIALWAILIATIPTATAQEFHENTKYATVLIISYDAQGDPIGRGSGFYIDEGIVITNIHVIGGYGRYYRIFITEDDGEYDPNCYKDITRSDVKLNLEDDVAYIRVYIQCPHTSVFFADEDPEVGSDIQVYGYPANNNAYNMISNNGTILSEYPATIGLKSYRGPWLLSDALIHGGNSGGPVVQDGKVVGIAVASHQDSEGTARDGIFIPVSIIRSGLANANNSTFGYTPQEQQKNTAYIEPEPENPFGTAGDPFDPLRKKEIASNSDCETSLKHTGEATGYGGCRCKPSYRKNAAKNDCVPGAVGYIDPYKDLVRRKIVVKQSSSSAKVVTPAFSDVQVWDKAYEEIAALKDLGVLGGYPDGTFKPRGNINRAELLKILMEGFHSAQLKGETECFPDVGSEWFAQYVCAAKHLGWVGGYPDGTFRPANSVNRAEAIKIVISSGVYTTPGYQQMPGDVEEGSWFYEFVAKGLNERIITSRGMFYPSNNLTRADAAVWIFNGI
jgi:hypothetical protein